MTDLERNTQTLKVLEDLLIEVGILSNEEKFIITSNTSSKLLDSLQGSIVFYWSLYDCSTTATTLGLDSQETESKIRSLRTAEELSECFLAAADPIWKEIKFWVLEGMEISFEEEEDINSDGDLEVLNSRKLPCFVKRNWEIQAQDSRFWKEGWTTATTSNENSNETEGRIAPSFVSSLSKNVLDTGKCVGLLRALGWDAEILGDGNSRSSGSLREIMHPEFGERNQVTTQQDLTTKPQEIEEKEDFLHGLLFGNRNSISTSRTDTSGLADLQIEVVNPTNNLKISSIASPPLSASSSSSDSSPPPSPTFQRGISQESMSQMISTSTFNSKLSAYLEPRLTLVQKRLHNVLTSSWNDGGCDLLAHVEGFLGLFLWRRAREVGQWMKVVFDQVSSRGLTLRLSSSGLA